MTEKGWDVMQKNEKNKKKIVFIAEQSQVKGDYPFERIAILANLLKDETLSILVKTNQDHILNLLNENELNFKTYNHFNELLQYIQSLKPEVIIQDGKDSIPEHVEQLREHCQTIIHFDDFGDGAHLADVNILSLLTENKELNPQNVISGSFAFAVSDKLKSIAQARTTNELSEVPHIVVCYEDGDENNLTYRTLRHLTQLQIPLKITVAIDHNYLHPIEDLQMMVLSRRNTKVFKKENALLHLLPTADIIICNANFTPYKVAAVGVPCITASQNERELNNLFPREENGFINLGLGRKMKQSNIQNAVMEFLLHPQRRERVIRKQLELEITNNNHLLHSCLLDVIYNRQNIVSH